MNRGSYAGKTPDIEPKWINFDDHTYDYLPYHRINEKKSLERQSAVQITLKWKKGAC